MHVEVKLHAGIVVPNPLEEFFLQVHMNQDGLLSQEQHAEAQQTTGKPACLTCASRPASVPQTAHISSGHQVDLTSGSAWYGKPES